MSGSRSGIGTQIFFGFLLGLKTGLQFVYDCHVRQKNVLKRCINCKLCPRPAVKCKSALRIEAAVPGVKGREKSAKSCFTADRRGEEINARADGRGLGVFSGHAFNSNFIM